MNPEFQGQKRRLKVTNIIEGMNVLEQTPIKDYTILSNTFVWGDIGIAIIATIIFFIKIKNKNQIRFKDREAKMFLAFYILGLGMSLFSVIRFPWFYLETGRFTYKCTFADSVSANYIDEKFDIISVEDGVWTIEDR